MRNPRDSEALDSSEKLAALDIAQVRQDFPALHQTVHGAPLVYLDNAATTQKPAVVIDRVHKYYSSENSNVHRGVHYLSEVASREYEATRERLKAFLNASNTQEIIFVRGTTEAINLVASSYGRSTLQIGDEILITGMEHHSNIVPWQILCEQTGARLQVAPFSETGELDLEQFETLLSDRTRIVSVVHMSNSLGTINPVKKITQLAHQRGAVVMLDGAQAASHQRIDVQDLNCDFYAFSGHKIYGPTGIGVLYGRESILEAMPPYQGGGDMIRSVTFEETLYNTLPHKFEAGTPNIAGVIGLGSAIEYIEGIGHGPINLHETDLLHYGTGKLADIEKVRLIGTSPNKASILSFVIEGIHPHDIGTVLDRDGIAIRTGHHCTQPLMSRLGLSATARASIGVYNTREELDSLARGVQKVIEVFHE